MEYNLKEDEWLLKVRRKEGKPAVGFLTKLNRDGSIPKAFTNWERNVSNTQENLPIVVHLEEFTSGWCISDWRYGESRNWAVMLHPDGFTLEIHLEEFLKLLHEITVINGELVGEFKWDKTKLIKQ
jgi:hypothetical protein